jgi:hypothetical protein
MSENIRGTVRGIFLILCVMMLFLCSCAQEAVVEPAAPEPTSASVVFSTDLKAIAATIDMQIAYWQYKATARFNVQSPSYIEGQTDWKTMTVTNYESTRQGPFTQGEWTFGVRALNANGKVIYQGETTAIVKLLDKDAVQANYVSVVLAAINDGRGSIRLNVTTNTTSETGMSAKLMYRKTGSSTWRTFTNFSKANANGKTCFTATITDVESGNYVLNFTVMESTTTVGGQSLSCTVLPDEQTIISGDIIPSAYVGGILDVEIPNIMAGNITYNATARIGVPLTMRWNNTGTASPSTIIWSVSGVYSGTGTNFTYTPTEFGEYPISCVAYNGNEEVGSCTIILKVVN